MKKKVVNSKIVFTITVLFLVCCFMATSSWAARKIEINSANARGFIGQLNQNGAEMGPIFGLSSDEGFQLLRQGTDFNGETHYRYQQIYKGIPVWGMQTIVSKDHGNKVEKLHGSFVQGSPGDVGGIPASLDPLGALRQMQELHKEKDSGAAWNFRNEKYGTFVYFHKKSKKARLCYVVSYFADTECGNPSQPIFFIDAKNGKVLDSYDMLRYADGVGPGGNLKIGYYYYGTDFPAFGVAEAGSTCTMDFADVNTVDLNHGTTGSTPFSYTCYENLVKEINGAYSPLNDAQFFGQVVYDMYMAWYGVPVLPFQLTMRCHYSTNYENAFWDGSAMTFGDGYTTFYPLVALDVSAHEVSHGFTEFNSGLIYSSQPGGINEAFSDMAGEASEYYSRGSTDYMCGYDIFKNPTGALRYLYDPPLDGISIDHVDDYYEGMDVHYSSGIFNKAFWLIATSPGWTARMSFDIFVRANMVYWTPGTTFQQGAEGVRDATKDLGYPCTDVSDAFGVVGITIYCGESWFADFDFSTSHLNRTVVFTDTSYWPGSTITNWDWDFGDGNTSTAQHPTHTYAADGTYTVTLTVTNSTSDTDSTSKDVTVPGPPPSVGNTEIFSSRSVSIYRRAMPFTMPETGTISSVNMYHDAGTGSMILGVYDGEGMPANRLGLTPATPLNPVADWQTIDLTSPVEIQGNTTVWLAWVYETNPGIAYKTGTPGRVESPDTWAGGMPDPYGTGIQADFLYSIFAYYTTDGCLPPTADFTYDIICPDRTVNFTDTSTDTDGTIVSWLWDFGDGNTSTLQNPSHTYAADGNYTVTLTVTDDCTTPLPLTDSISKDVIVNCDQLEIFVNDITQTIRKKGKNYESTAVVTIWDTSSAPVANATVTITWSDAVSGSASGVTLADGTVSFKSAKVKSTGPFTITVDNVTHATLPYNPALNVETSDSATY